MGAGVNERFQFYAPVMCHVADWNHVDTLWMPPMRTSLLAVLCLAAVHEASCWLPTPRLLPARPCVPLSRHAVSPRLDEAKGVDALITELRGSVRASTLSAFIPCASSHVARAASLSPLHRVCTCCAQTPDQLPKLLADNLKSIDQRLFLRLAEMSDEETDDYEKLRIRQLATLVASTLETILEQATDNVRNGDRTKKTGELKIKRVVNGDIIAAVRSNPDLARLFSGFAFSSHAAAHKPTNFILSAAEKEKRKQAKEARDLKKGVVPKKGGKASRALGN